MNENENIRELFGPKGPLAGKMDNYEYREQQIDLAERVYGAIKKGNGTVLAAEAPPGIGKTFALLLPAMLWARRSGCKILFLTAGLTLQDQLFYKDIPRLLSALDMDMPFGVLKGRNNYVCLRRAERQEMEGFLSYRGGEDPSAVIKQWLGRTVTGELSELSLPPSHPAVFQIAGSHRGCLGSSCPYRSDCFIQKAIRKSQNWQITVANYHLFFAYILGAGKPFPTPFDVVFCDEAHRMAEAARSVSSISSTESDWSRILRSDPLSGLNSDSLKKCGIDPTEILHRARECRREAVEFFNLLDLKIPSGTVLPSGLGELGDRANDLVLNIRRIVRKLTRFRENHQGHDDFPGMVPDKKEALLFAWMEDLSELAESMEWCVRSEEYPRWAYWKEDSTLLSSPAVCGDLLSGAFSSCDPHAIIAVSATMAVDRSFAFWKEETGIIPHESLILDSPFDLRSQMKIAVVDVGLKVIDHGYDERICRIIEKLCDDNGGRTLVLLSSYRLLKKVAAKMSAGKKEYSVLVQGDLPRTDLLARFREDLTSVLIGTVSFREGVDVPGDGLTQVLIDRIPFPHPRDPILETRKKLQGRDTFMKVVLPMAKMQLRQAVGRLIRTKDDHGRVVILDGRVLDHARWKIPDSLPNVKYLRLFVRDNSVAPHGRV